MAIAAEGVLKVKANWKILVEGGIEAYHFKNTHRQTIGPHFLDNLSSFDMLGPHIRSVLARNTVKDIADVPKEEWDIRAHSNILYTLMPLDQFLVMEDHIIWINAKATDVNLTELRISTLALKSDLAEEKQGHWDRNHHIALTTLQEDFEINESVQNGLLTGANDMLTFGRFESALERFNEEVEKYLKQ